jgi:hypothetical protein
MFVALVAVVAVPTVSADPETQVGELVPPEIRNCPAVPARLRPSPVAVL